MKKLFLSILFISIVTSLWSNGGPVDWSLVFGAGDARLINVSSVSLSKEKLSFTIKKDYIKVEVEYVLERTDWDDSTEVLYGFPIDFSDNMDYGAGYQWDERNIKDLQFVINGKKLVYKTQEDLGVYTKTIELKDYDGNFYESERNLKRKWFYTAFNLKKGEAVTLRVSYLIMPSFEDSATSKSFFTYFGERSLYWDFTPAGYWGNGTAVDFEVSLSVDKDAIDNGSLSIEGLPMTLENDVYSYKVTGFDLKSAAPLYIRYMQNRIKNEHDIKKHNVLRTDRLVSIKTSSSKQGYPSKNLNDDNLSTAWCPEGNGIGEWIEVETKQMILASIFLVNGYTKSKETYYNNNRVKAVRIQYGTEDYNNDIYIDDIPFEQPIDLMSYIILDSEGYASYEKVRITILDVYKGSKYDDTCISELLIMGYVPDEHE